MSYKLVGPPSRAVDASLPEAYVMHSGYIHRDLVIGFRGQARRT